MGIKLKTRGTSKEIPLIPAAEVHLGYVQASYAMMCFEPIVKREHLAVILKSSALPFSLLLFSRW